VKNGTRISHLVLSKLFFIIFFGLINTAIAENTRLEIVSLRTPEFIHQGEVLDVFVTARDTVGISAVELTFEGKKIRLSANGKNSVQLKTKLKNYSAGILKLEAIAIGVDGNRGKKVISTITSGQVLATKFSRPPAIYYKKLNEWRKIGYRQKIAFDRGEFYKTSSIKPENYKIRSKTLNNNVKPQPNVKYKIDKKIIRSPALDKAINKKIYNLFSPHQIVDNWWITWLKAGGSRPFNWKKFCPGITKGISTDGEVLKCWLALNPRVANSINWKDINPTNGNTTSIAYPGWSHSRKNQLYIAFYYAWDWLNNGLVHYKGGRMIDPPVNQVKLEDGQSPVTALSYGAAWSLYLTTIAHSLALEIGGFTPWSILNYSTDDILVLFHSSGMLNAGTYDMTNANNDKPVKFIGYWPKGYVTPAPATKTFKFIVDNSIIQYSHFNTVSQLLKWGRERMRHYGYIWVAENAYDHWQYRGQAPASRIMDGTLRLGKYKGSPTIKPVGWSPQGCHGVSHFFKIVLRAVNIPSGELRIMGHNTPLFGTIGRTLSHGDDVYAVNFNIPSRNPSYLPAQKLLITLDQFNNWFTPRGYNAQNNVGRRVYDVALEILPHKLLDLYCDDLQVPGMNIKYGSVYATFQRWYSFKQLYLAGLWNRLQKKESMLDYCNTRPDREFY